MSNQADFKVFREINRAEFVKAIEKHNQKVLYMAPWTPNQIYTKKPIKSVDDLKGIKMRSVDRNTTELARRMGMVPVQGDRRRHPCARVGRAGGAHDLARHRGRPEGREFAKYGYLTNHIWASNAMVVNKDAWGKLKPEHQAAIEKAARDMEPGFWEIAAGDDAIRMKQMRDAGMILKEPPADVSSAMQAAAKPMWEEFANTVGGPVPANLKAYLARTGK